MSKKVHSVPYEPRFGVDIPAAGFPLPIPVALPGEIRAQWWADLLAYAEAYVQRTPEQLTAFPRKFWNTSKKNVFVSALASEIVVGMDFYARWTAHETEERYEGIDTVRLAQKERDSVLRAVGLARSLDWSQFVVGEYLESLRRCRALCDATRRGHLAEVGALLSFGRGEVGEVMKNANGFVGVVDYDHICKILLMEAQLQIPEGIAPHPLELK